MVVDQRKLGCGCAAAAGIVLAATWLAGAAAAGRTTRAPVLAASAVPMTAYVVSYGSATVTPIRVATNRALRTIRVGVRPDAIAITPDGRTAYVANYGSGTVTPIRTATNTALKPVRVGAGPVATVAITPDGATGYVVSGGVPGSPACGSGCTVTPIRTATNTALTPINAGVYPDAIAITLDGTTA
jgi:hyaluronoglucosaminidase